MDSGAGAGVVGEVGPGRLRMTSGRLFSGFNVGNLLQVRIDFQTETTADAHHFVRSGGWATYSKYGIAFGKKANRDRMKDFVKSVDRQSSLIRQDSPVGAQAILPVSECGRREKWVRNTVACVRRSPGLKPDHHLCRSDKARLMRIIIALLWLSGTQAPFPVMLAGV